MKERKRKTDELSQISEPQKVKVLILTQQHISYQDFFFIKNFVNVKKMDLSYNKLTNFPVGFSFSMFNCLSILFLHYNKFPNIKSLVPLIENKNLQYLTLFGNPLQETKTRHYFVNEIQTLKLMDDKIVKVQQRSPQPLQYDTSSVNLGFPLFSQEETQNSTTFLATLVAQLKIIRQKYLECNPIVKIQRQWKAKINKSNNKQKIDNSKQYLDTTKKIQQPKEFKEPKQPSQSLIPIKSYQEKIVALFMMNSQFWEKIKQMSIKKIYCLREYCQINNISFKQTNEILAFRIPTPSSISSKKFLNFFIESNSFLLAIKANNHKYENLPDSILNNCFNKNQQLKFETSQKKLTQLYTKYQNRLVQVDLTAQQKSSLVKKKYKICLEKKTIFPFFFEELLERTLSSIKIQKMWRGYLSRKKFTASKMIQRKNAAIKIQRWIRKLPFIHRHKFLLYVSQYIAKSYSNCIIFPFKLLYDKLNVSNQKIRLYFHFLIPFQSCNFSIDQSSIRFYSDRLPYPQYMRKHLSIELVSRKQTLSTLPNLFDIVFKQAQKVQYFNVQGSKYVRFTYSAAQQVRNRKFILALLSYNMHNHNFLESFDNLEPKQSHLKSVNQQIKNQVMIASQYKMHNEINVWTKLKIKYFNGKDNHTTTLKIGWLKQAQILPNKSLREKIQKIGRTQPHPIHRSYMVLQKQVTQKLSQRYSIQPKHNQITSIFNQNKKLQQSISNSSINYLYSQSQLLQKEILNNLEDKKSRVKDIKETHRQKSLKIWAEKQQHLKKIREQTLQSQKQTLQAIKSLKISQKLRNIEKCRQIKRNSNKNDDDFEKSFLNRGNRSMKIQMLKFEKKEHGNQSSRLRYQKPIKDKQSIKSMYTEIKQFSQSISNDVFSEYKKDTSNEQLFSLLNAPDKPNIKAKFNEARNMQHISRETNQQQVRRVLQHQSQIKAYNLAQYRQPMKRMKKLIHSVFPEQFYPLQQSGQFGFQLPKIQNKK